MWMRTAAVAVALGLAACGNNDSQLRSSTRADCDSLEPGATLRQAQTLMHDALVVFGGCQSGLLPVGNMSCGEPASVCMVRFGWQSSGDCGPGGCAYVCEVRTADVANGNAPPIDTPICAHRFLTQQPY